MEGKIDMAARRQVTNKLRNKYRKASLVDKGRILDQIVDTTGMGRSTARRMLTGPVLADPASQIDKRSVRPRTYSDDSRALLEHVRVLGRPCGKYLVVMVDTWVPLLQAAGDLDRPFATPEAIDELGSMSAATVDRYLGPIRAKLALKGISTTKRSPLLRNSITVRACGAEPPEAPGVIEADTVAHCGPSASGEFARTLTMTDIFSGWNENYAIRNNATTWIIEAVGALADRFPFPMTVFDSDIHTEWRLGVHQP